LDEKVKIKIEHEISRIGKLISDAKPLLDLCELKEPDFIQITAAAQVLHSFYNGIEGVVILYFKNTGEVLPNDTRWHKTLFEMIFGKNAKENKLINDKIKEKLEKYLLFRHYIRHAYTSELIWEEFKPLVNGLREIWEKIKIDFEKLLNDNQN